MGFYVPEKSAAEGTKSSVYLFRTLYFHCSGQTERISTGGAFLEVEQCRETRILPPRSSIFGTYRFPGSFSVHSVHESTIL